MWQIYPSSFSLLISSKFSLQVCWIVDGDNYNLQQTNYFHVWITLGKSVLVYLIEVGINTIITIFTYTYSHRDTDWIYCLYFTTWWDEMHIGSPLDQIPIYDNSLLGLSSCSRLLVDKNIRIFSKGRWQLKSLLVIKNS